MSTTIFDWLPHVPGILDFVIAVGGFVLAMVAINKYVIQPLRHKAKRYDRAIDAVLGYPAVTDPSTGRELQAETPSIAERVYNLEESSITMATALDSIAKSLEKMTDLETAVLDMSKRFSEHEEASHKWAKGHQAWIENWIEEHNGLHSVVSDKSVKPPDLDPDQPVGP